MILALKRRHMAPAVQALAVFQVGKSVRMFPGMGRRVHQCVVQTSAGSPGTFSKLHNNCPGLSGKVSSFRFHG
jgi:hypothetical protein